MTESHLPPSRGLVLSLCVTFVLLGLGYAVPVTPAWSPNWRSPEVANLFSLAAWMGLAHFVFAFRGQAGRFVVARKPGGLVAWTLTIIASLLLLIVARTAAPRVVFDSAIWIYFLPHLIKAEVLFGQAARKFANVAYPTVAFIFFTAVLYGRSWFLLHPWLIVIGGFALGAVAPLLVLRGVAEVPVIISCFLLGEAMVWGTYAKYMSDYFADGIYTFHVAGASFFHYLRCYFHAAQRQPVPLLFWTQVIAVNLAVIVLGIFLTHGLIPLVWIFSPAFFTLWVGLHLLASDWHKFALDRISLRGTEFLVSAGSGHRGQAGS